MFAAHAIEATDKASFYRELCDQLRGLLDGEHDAIANAANTSALIFQTMPDINWAGFYFLQSPDELVVGPFQGKPACVRIAVGKGVCGTAVAQSRTILVDDVHQFPGHIACDAASRSELVVPLLREERCSASSISTVRCPAGSISKTRLASKGWRPSILRLVLATDDPTDAMATPNRYEPSHFREIAGYGMTDTASLTHRVTHSVFPHGRGASPARGMTALARIGQTLARTCIDTQGAPQAWTVQRSNSAAANCTERSSSVSPWCQPQEVMMADRIGVLKYPVSVTPVSGVPLTRLKQRLDVMEREVNHLRTAVADMKNGLNRGDNRLLTSGVMNSRNWALSVVMSHTYIQCILGGGATGSSGFPGQATPMPSFQAEILFARAGKAGAEDGTRDRTI